ncbi:MAG: hypothetical protein ACT6FE_03990 [Methanosarcinaceae archaeon]
MEFYKQGYVLDIPDFINVKYTEKNDPYYICIKIKIAGEDMHVQYKQNHLINSNIYIQIIDKFQYCSLLTLFNIFRINGSWQKGFIAEETYFSLRASAVFQTIPEDNKKSFHFS